MVKKYSYDHEGMWEDENGNWYHKSDYALLAAENERLRGVLEKVAYDTCNGIGCDVCGSSDDCDFQEYRELARREAGGDE